MDGHMFQMALGVKIEAGGVGGMQFAANGWPERDMKRDRLNQIRGHLRFRGHQERIKAVIA